jgi:hypothetical protein
VKTLKQLLDQVNAEAGFDVPYQYFQNPDPNILQLIAIANRSAVTLRDMRLQLLSRHASISMDAGTPAFTTDGRIQSFDLPSDYYGLVPDTTYQSGRLDNVILPSSAPVWAYLISRMGNVTLPIRCRIIQNKLMVFSPETGQTIEFEYISKYTISNVVGGAQETFLSKETFTADSDVWMLDDALIELDIKWRYKREKGLDWQEDYQSFVLYSNELRARDGGSRTVGWPKDYPFPNEPFTNLYVA